MENLTLQLDNLTVNGDNSSLLNNTTTSYQFEIADLYEPTLFDVYVAPVISSLGMIGNSLSFIVMIQLSRESSFYLYLAVLAMGDFGVSLFGGFLVWLDTIGVLQLFGSSEHSWCSPIFACNLISSQYSSWITVAVSVDRYIAVCHPFKVATYCTRKRAIITLACIFLAIVALDSPMLCFEWNADYTACNFPQHSIDFCLEYLIITDLPTYTLVPIAILSVFSVLIVRGLYVASDRRRNLSNKDIPCVRKIKISTRNTVILLLVVVSTFIVLSIPLICLQLYTLIVGNEFLRSYPLVFVVINTISVLNHVANFILYGLSGKVFRDQFLKMVCCYRK